MDDKPIPLLGMVFGGAIAVFIFIAIAPLLLKVALMLVYAAGLILTFGGPFYAFMADKKMEQPAKIRQAVSLCAAGIFLIVLSILVSAGLKSAGLDVFKESKKSQYRSHEDYYRSSPARRR